jgi:hypothetical protein
VAANIPLKAVMDEAGHRVAATTNRYTHLADDYVIDIVRSKAACRIGLPDAI